MEAKSFKPHLTVIGLMVLTSIALALTVDVTATDEAGIKVLLPDQVGAWAGQEIRFCQNPACQKEWELKDLKDRNVCPACGGQLDGMTVDERRQLPLDTIVLKKHYHLMAQNVYVSIVLSGKERASIHRPQICLVGQGNEIVKSVVLPVPLDGRAPLKVMSLEMLRRGVNAQGQRAEAATYYAYWFVGKGRETPYHLQRMVWMATDRIFRNVSHRWAYIAVAGMRPDDKTYRQEVVSFVHDLYPQIVAN